MKHIRKLIAANICLLALNVCSQAGGGNQGSWKKLPGGAGTSCADGSSYFFFVRSGDRKHLLIYFQGGGACWSAGTCDQSQNLYRPNLNGINLSNELGIFDFTNHENPFRKYTVVFVPYCTGDVHLGNRPATYAIESTERPAMASFHVHHKGYTNAMSALKWVFANDKSPNSIFVAGGSAGAMASPFYAGRIADQYPKARVVQLGDSAGGLNVPLMPKLFDAWAAIDVLSEFAPYKALDPGTANLVTLYRTEGETHPSIIFSQFNNAFDARQIFGLRVFGVKTPLVEMIEKNYADIRTAVPGLHTFTASGDLHVILNRPEFYTVTVQNVRLRDWVAALASGKAPPDVTSSGKQ